MIFTPARNGKLSQSEDGGWRMEGGEEWQGNDCQGNMPELFFPFR